VPPLETPSDQVRPIWVAKVTDGLFAKLSGASGTRTIKAVPPTGDGGELPFMFIAVT